MGGPARTVVLRLLLGKPNVGALQTNTQPVRTQVGRGRRSAPANAIHLDAEP